MNISLLVRIGVGGGLRSKKARLNYVNGKSVGNGGCGNESRLNKA